VSLNFPLVSVQQLVNIKCYFLACKIAPPSFNLLEIVAVTIGQKVNLTNDNWL